MLLKMRNIPPKTQTGPDDGLLHLVDRSHEAASRWFDLLHLTSELLPVHSFRCDKAMTRSSQTTSSRRGDQPTSIPWIPEA